MTNEWLDVHGVAAFLDRSPHTIRRWFRAGVGPPAYKVNGTIRFRRDEVETWLEGHRHDPDRVAS